MIPSLAVSSSLSTDTIVLSSGGAVVWDGIEGTTLGRLRSFLIGAFLPITFFNFMLEVESSNFDDSESVLNVSLVTLDFKSGFSSPNVVET